MHMNTEAFPSYRIAYFRKTGPYGPSNVQAMEKLKDWAKERNLLTESAILFGIPQDNPETTLPENCRYDACIVISRDYPIGDSICEGQFSGGDYAVCIVKHTAEEIRRAWAKLLSAIQAKSLTMIFAKFAYLL